MSDDRRAASPCWAPWWVEAYWDEHKKTLMEPSRKSPSVEHHLLKFCDSFRFFIVKTPDTFTNVSPFLIEKAFTSSIGEVKSIRKMRSGDLFLEASSAKQATALINLQKLAHLDVTVAPHTTLNFRAVSFHQRIFSMCRLRKSKRTCRPKTSVMLGV
ncbi:uncharacterized protein TNCV_1584931 [Trichonephila clavipes]|nr:uncharacterized protein TNCV_1584931 [Trichonephila clavipes]